MKEYDLGKRKDREQKMVDARNQMKAKKGPFWELWKVQTHDARTQMKAKKGPYWEEYLRNMRAFVEREEKKLLVRLRKKGRDFS